MAAQKMRRLRSVKPMRGREATMRDRRTVRLVRALRGKGV